MQNDAVTKYTISRLSQEASRMLLGCGIASLALLAMMPSAAQGQAKPNTCERKVDTIINNEMRNVGTPGFMVSIYQNSKPSLEKGYGRVSLPSGRVPDANTIFTIGSLSKAVTGVGALILYGQGKLDLEAPISRYLPGVPQSWSDIPVNKFLSHSSGIPRLDDIKETDFNATLRAAANLPLAFTPGTKTAYNNFNFAVIGQVIAAQSKQRYIDFMNRQIFTPLKMTSTGTVTKTTRSATGYDIDKQDNNPKPVNNSHWLADGTDAFGIASGGLQSSAADLQRLATALETKTLLPPKATLELLKPVEVNKRGRKQPILYTSAGFIYTDASGTGVLHKTGGGSGVGTGAAMMLVPDKNISVVLLRNLFAPGRATSNGALAAAVIEACFGIKVPDAGDDGND